MNGKKIYGALSDRVDALIIELMTGPSPLSALETARTINEALKREQFSQRLTAQGVQDRKDKLHLTKEVVFPSLVSQAKTKHRLPRVVIGLDPKTDTANVWTQERIEIVRTYYARSRTVFTDESLKTLWKELLARLADTGITATKSSVMNLVHHADRSLYGEFGQWGMTKVDRDQLKRSIIDATLPRAESMKTAREYYQCFVQAFADHSLKIKTTVRTVQSWMQELGYTLPDYVTKSGKLQRAKEAHAKLSKKAQRHILFASVWNNRQLQLRHEIQQKLRNAGHTVQSWKEVWSLRDLYKRYQKNHPELDHWLPKLIVRQYHTGEPKDLHPFVEMHLDEWKYDRKRIKRAKGYVIGNYQWGSLPNLEVIAAVKQYCSYRGYEFVVGLSQYGKIEVDRDTDELLTVLPDELKGHIVVDNVTMADFMLDCNTHIVQTSAEYLTDSVCGIAGEQSTIFLGTKQEMRHMMRLEHEYPACYMTTGSLNHPHHKRTRLGKNNKAVAVAKNNHEFGIVVLELVHDPVHGQFAIPRQLWITPEGQFYDIDAVHGGARLFTPHGHMHCPDGIDTQKDGDLHEAGVDETIWNITHENEDAISRVLAPLHVHLGDTFDNKWGNPFRERQTVRAAYQAEHGMNSIRAELEACVARLKRLRAALPERTVSITLEPSNHSDDWLQRWINRGNLQEDPLNSPLLCELWLAVYHRLKEEGRSIADKDAVEEKSPFGLYVKSHLPFVDCPSYQELDQVMRPLPGPGVLRRVFMSHGHIGPKGVETRSIHSFAGFNKKAAGGHVHSARRHNGHDQVGVMTGRRKHYVRGPKTNWTNSHLGIFKNGFAAHLFIIHGRWYGDDVRDARQRLGKPVSLG